MPRRGPVKSVFVTATLARACWRVKCCSVPPVERRILGRGTSAEARRRTRSVLRLATGATRMTLTGSTRRLRNTRRERRTGPRREGADSCSRRATKRGRASRKRKSSEACKTPANTTTSTEPSTVSWLPTSTSTVGRPAPALTATSGLAVRSTSAGARTKTSRAWPCTRSPTCLASASTASGVTTCRRRAKTMRNSAGRGFGPGSTRAPCMRSGNK
mmetsp:Transcript_20366/g.51433  ORF Transcript_20366/g.51433 Transcript_20366/m.51433 type:complete len:216 (+) Transcript_20366:296-943(+)